MAEEATENFPLQPAIVPSERPGPTGGKRDRNRRVRTQQIADGALELFLQEGLDAVTIDGIVGSAGIAKGSFYRYFDSKAHVVETLFEPMRQHVSAAMNICRMNLSSESTRDDVMRAYQELGSTLFSAFLRYRDVTLLFLQESRGPATEVRQPLHVLRGDLRDVCVALARAASRHGIIRDIPAEVAAITVLGIAENVIFEYLTNDDIMRSDQLAGAVFEVILSGVLSERLQLNG